jgi:hypothetical protein
VRWGPAQVGARRDRCGVRSSALRAGGGLAARVVTQRKEEASYFSFGLSMARPLSMTTSKSTLRPFDFARS